LNYTHQKELVHRKKIIAAKLLRHFYGAENAKKTSALAYRTCP